MTRATVFVVDDDDAVRDSLGFLLKAEGHEVETYASGADFLAQYRPERPGCLMLDISMPGLSGLDVQKELVLRGMGIPIIFLTGRGDVEMARRVFEAGAFAFLDKPVNMSSLATTIRDAIAEDRKRRDG